MGSSLMYSAGVSGRENHLHPQLKYILAPLIWDGFDGTEGSSKAVLDKTDLTMLRESKKTAQKYSDKEILVSIQRVINSIKRNGWVEIWLQR